MSPQSIREYVQAILPRYRQANRREKGRLLDEVCRLTRYHRKAAIRLLHRRPRRPRERRGRPPRYGPAIQHALERIWEASGRLSSKRLSPFLPELVAALERHDELALPPVDRALLVAVSAPTIDRLLRPMRRRLGRHPQTSTRAVTAIQRQVPIRTFAEWADVPPGAAQADLVSHCGTWPDGFYLRTLVAVDVRTSWTEYEAIWGGTQQRVGTAVHHARQRFPLGLQALHTDNDAAFLNRLLYAWCQREGVHLTRGRPYRKNDQAFAEQKIGAHVRALVGYGRYSTQAAYHQLQDLYRLLRLQVNFFQPVAKLIARQRLGPRITKRYDRARTPYQRTLEMGILTPQQRQALEALYLGLNPVHLRAQITTALEKLWRLADPHF